MLEDYKPLYDGAVCNLLFYFFFPDTKTDTNDVDPKLSDDSVNIVVNILIKYIFIV